jgi:hypothetical protein
LRGDPQLLDLLRASVAGNVETVLDALRYDISIERVEPPTAALEYARRLAQRGIPANALVRAYRLGQQAMLAHLLEEIRRAGLEPALALQAFEAISNVTFRYIDWISQLVIDAYETERVRWVENRNSVRAVRVRELLDAPGDLVGQTDIDATTEAIRYPLRRTHSSGDLVDRCAQDARRRTAQVGAIPAGAGRFAGIARRSVIRGGRSRQWVGLATPVVGDGVDRPDPVDCR